MEHQDKSEVGKWGEEVARKFLEKEGYVILETNWHSSHKEVDIIAQSNNCIVFVEVKTRTSNFINPADAVNKQKQKFLMYAANYYVWSKGLDLDVRFDIITIVAIHGKVEIEHMKNAFYPKIEYRR
jgi:putative endonuclease